MDGGVRDDPEISFDEQYWTLLHSPEMRGGSPMRLTTPLALVGDDQGGTPPDREAPHIRRREETRRGLLRLTTPLPPLGNDRKVGRMPPDRSRGESTEIYDDTGAMFKMIATPAVHCL